MTAEPCGTGMDHRKASRRALLAATLMALSSLSCRPAPAEDRGQEASAEYERGLALRRSGDLEAAAAAFQRAVEFDIELGAAWFQLGILRSAAQDWIGAIEAYRRAIELEPRDAKAQNNLANVYFRQGDYAEAERWYRGALEVDPAYMAATFHYGWALREQGRLAEAEEQFARCLDLPVSRARERKTHFDCLHYLGGLRFRSGDYEQAAAIMERVLAEYSDHSEARYYLGMSYRQLGRMEEAREQLAIHDRAKRLVRSIDPVERPYEP